MNEQKMNLKFCFKLYCHWGWVLVSQVRPWTAKVVVKRQSMEWRSPASPRRKKVRAEKSRIKTMLITFFDNQGIIHKEFLPEGTTMNAARYIEILTRFMKRLRRVRPQYAQQGSWFFCSRQCSPSHSQYRQTVIGKKRRGWGGGGGANWTSTILARSQSSRLLPIPTTQTRFERKEIWRYTWHPTKRDEAFEHHPKRRLLAKFPGHV